MANASASLVEADHSYRFPQSKALGAGVEAVQWLRCIASIALLSAVSIRAMSLKYCVRDYDLWWHLGVGDWISEHLALPRTGILSATAGDRPWIAYSWGYEVLLSRISHWFGISGVAIFGVALTVAIAGCLLWMLQRLCGRFWAALLLTLLACNAFLFNLMPRPVFASIMLFCITVTVIFEVQSSGQVRKLYWLPPLFMLWANLHIQFVYGLFVFGLFVGITAIQQIGSEFRRCPEWLVGSRLPLRPLTVAFVASVAATCVGPNSYHVYEVIYHYATAKVIYSALEEMQPNNFRALSHYVQLLLMAAAFFALGRRRLDIFKLSLLTIATVVAFRTARDSWFICIPAAACIADKLRQGVIQKRPVRWLESAAVLSGVILVSLFLGRSLAFDRAHLQQAVNAEFPVGAVTYLREHPSPGPLYNSFGWGGYLMWALPDMPVAIDGRTDLYGEELDSLFFATERGQSLYLIEDDPYLSDAGTILLPKRLPLTVLLRTDRSLKVVYDDDLAVVFVRSQSYAN